MSSFTNVLYAGLSFLVFIFGVVIAFVLDDFIKSKINSGLGKREDISHGVIIVKDE